MEQVSGAKYLIDYILTMDTAKEMAMLERNEKGKMVRRYFIEYEGLQCRMEIGSDLS